MASEYPTTPADYLSIGWKVFPVVKGEKTPKVKEWQNYSGAVAANLDNLGVVTGEASGIVVLDIDPRHGGWESLSELEKTHGSLPETLRSITANGGAHFFFAHPKSRPVRNGTAIYDKPGVDIRGDGGYVVVPPSLLSDNKQYVWDVGSPMELASLPDWLAAHGENRLRSTAVQEDEAFPEGTRNDSLARVAGSLRHFGTPRDVLVKTLLDINQSKCRPPLPEQEVIAIADSVSRYKQEYAPKAAPKPTALSIPSTEFVNMDVKPAVWLVQGIWPEGAVGFIAGMGKSFKSFLSLELGYSLASGVDFIGKFKVPEPRRVLLVQQESSLGAYQVRVANVARRMGPSENLFIVSNKHLSLESPTDVERLENEIARVRPALLILDPLASFLHGDENSAQHMGEVVSTIRRLRDDYGCAICIVHHNRKDGTAMRGSTALYNASEVTVKMQRTADRESLTSEVNVELKEFEGPPPFAVVMDSETCELRIKAGGPELPMDLVQALWSEERGYHDER